MSYFIVNSMIQNYLFRFYLCYAKTNIMILKMIMVITGNKTFLINIFLTFALQCDITPVMTLRVAAVHNVLIIFTALYIIHHNWHSIAI